MAHLFAQIVVLSFTVSIVLQLLLVSSGHSRVGETSRMCRSGVRRGKGDWRLRRIVVGITIFSVIE